MTTFRLGSLTKADSLRLSAQVGKQKKDEKKIMRECLNDEKYHKMWKWMEPPSPSSSNKMPSAH